MPDPQPKRPWWRKKRWWAALALWLVVAYPVSLGPTAYFTERWRLPKWPAMLAYAPVIGVANATDPLSQPYKNFVEWCADLGQGQAASD